jgi:hypothetical protein
MYFMILQPPAENLRSDAGVVASRLFLLMWPLDEASPIVFKKLGHCVAEPLRFTVCPLVLVNSSRFQ